MSNLFGGLSGWDWLEIISLGAVSIGAICALILRSRKSKISPDENGLIPIPAFFEKEKVESKKHRWELFWELLLIVGLIGEIPATKHSISESARLNNENLVLEMKTRPRMIMPEKVNDFIALAKKCPFQKSAIFLCLGRQEDDETYNFASQINELLGYAGFQQVEFPSIETITETNFFIKKRIFDNTANCYDVWILEGVATGQTNYFDISPETRPELFSDNLTNSIRCEYAYVAWGLEKIGIRVVWERTTYPPFRGAEYIYIPPKFY